MAEFEEVDLMTGKSLSMDRKERDKRISDALVKEGVITEEERKKVDELPLPEE